MSLNRHELMDFKKFAQSKKGLMYRDERILIEGVFKEGRKIVKGDRFYANKIWVSEKKINLELIYKTYLEWFNYTRNEDEPERIFVSVKQITGDNLK